MRTTAARAFAGLAFAVGLPLAMAGVAAAQSGPSGPSGPGQPTTTPTTQGVSPTTTPRTGGLARTGGDAALPLAASAAAITVVLGGRRLAARLNG